MRPYRPGAGCRVLAVLPSGGPGDAHGTILSPDGKLADLPEWIPEALVEHQHEDACSAAIVTEDVYGLPTLRGIRSRTLFKWRAHSGHGEPTTPQSPQLFQPLMPTEAHRRWSTRR
jgi:hypothetical protein